MKLPIQDIKKVAARVETLMGIEGLKTDELTKARVILIYLQAQRDLLQELKKEDK